MNKVISQGNQQSLRESQLKPRNPGIQTVQEFCMKKHGTAPFKINQVKVMDKPPSRRTSFLYNLHTNSVSNIAQVVNKEQVNSNIVTTGDIISKSEENRRKQFGMEKRREYNQAKLKLRSSAALKKNEIRLEKVIDIEQLKQKIRDLNQDIRNRWTLLYRCQLLGLRLSKVYKDIFEKSMASIRQAPLKDAGTLSLILKEIVVEQDPEYGNIVNRKVILGKEIALK